MGRKAWFVVLLSVPCWRPRSSSSGRPGVLQLGLAWEHGERSAPMVRSRRANAIGCPTRGGTSSGPERYERELRGGPVNSRLHELTRLHEPSYVRMYSYNV
eukprot:scaffold83327_cov61-Phaeocystis_antarctica.AAC.4